MPHKDETTQALHQVQSAKLIRCLTSSSLSHALQTLHGSADEAYNRANLALLHGEFSWSSGGDPQGDQRHLNPQLLQSRILKNRAQFVSNTLLALGELQQPQLMAIHGT